MMWRHHNKTRFQLENNAKIWHSYKAQSFKCIHYHCCPHNFIICGYSPTNKQPLQNTICQSSYNFRLLTSKTQMFMHRLLHLNITSKKFSLPLLGGPVLGPGRTGPKTPGAGITGPGPKWTGRTGDVAMAEATSSGRTTTGRSMVATAQWMILIYATTGFITSLFYMNKLK